jgi:RNA polymerase sigma factor (sigma-70 family)
MLSLMPSAAPNEEPSLWTKVRDRVFRFAASWMSREAAEDLSQTVMIIMLEKYSQAMNPEEALAIAVGVLTRVRIGYYRKRVRRKEDQNEQVDVLPLADDRDNPERALGRRRAAAKVHTAIDALDEKCQRIIRLSLEGFGAKEIAELLRLPTPNSADLALSRCRGKLRSSLDVSLLDEI